MKRTFCLAAIALIATSRPAWAQQDEIARLRAELVNQQAVITRLLQRVDDLEKKQTTAVTKDDLEQEIKTEQDRANIHDPSHFAYPTYAKAAIQRRENLKHSADELRVQLNDAKEALAEAFEELKKVELLDERDQMRERAAEAAFEQTELDAIGLMRTRNASA